MTTPDRRAAVTQDRWVKNAAGVKDGASCYRTIGGVRWAWFAEDVEAFKGVGVRHRKAPDGQGCFVHPADNEKAFAAADRWHARQRAGLP